MQPTSNTFKEYLRLDADLDDPITSMTMDRELLAAYREMRNILRMQFRQAWNFIEDKFTNKKFRCLLKDDLVRKCLKQKVNGDFLRRYCKKLPKNPSSYRAKGKDLPVMPWDTPDEYTDEFEQVQTASAKQLGSAENYTTGSEGDEQPEPAQKPEPTRKRKQKAKPIVGDATDADSESPAQPKAKHQKTSRESVVLSNIKRSEYEGRTVKQLNRILKTRRIHVPSPTPKKAGLVDLLVNADEAAEGINQDGTNQSDVNSVRAEDTQPENNDEETQGGHDGQGAGAENSESGNNDEQMGDGDDGKLAEVEDAESEKPDEQMGGGDDGEVAEVDDTESKKADGKNE